jgi:hypothetical protein
MKPEIEPIKRLLDEAADAIARGQNLIAASRVNEALAALKRLP